MSSKKINEMSTAGAAMGTGSGFARQLKKEQNISGRVKSARVFEPKTDETNPDGSAKRGSGGAGTKVRNGKYRDAIFEKKSERALREAIRNLIFLNRVKYHEENAKREMQEQKIRRVIRFLLNEADSSRDINFSTTGAASAWNFITAIEKTTFTNDFATTLKSSKEQRDAFKIVYLTGIKIYLDSLDQQYLILNPEDQPGGAMPAAPAGQAELPAAQPDMSGAPPAKRSDRKGLEEQEEDPSMSADTHPAAAEAAPPPSAPADTSAIQTAAVKSALSTTQQAKLDKTGVNAAEAALNRDLPQIDPLYFNLTFKPITTSTGRNTNDRQEFRFFLIGDTNKVGNVQLKFKEWNEKMPIGGAAAGADTPKLDPNPLNLSDISSGGASGTPPAPAPTGPEANAGLPAGLPPV